MNKFLRAFTLAEVLITLGIIGVVAAMTIPTLISVNNQRAWDTASNVFIGKLGKSLSVMNTQNALGGWPTTEQFVNELQKHMKITKVCQNPTDCFENEISVGEEMKIVDISKIKKSKNLNSSADPDWNTNVMGVQFANGVSGLIAYNPKCRNTPFSNESGKTAVRVTSNADDAHSNNGKKATMSLETSCISILYDVNGYGGPNVFDTKSDMRGVNVNLGICEGIEYNGIGCIVNIEKAYDTVNCTSSNRTSDEYRKYCGNSPSGYSNDAWAGAKKACGEKGMALISNPAMRTLYYNSWEGKPSAGQFWTDSEYGNSRAHYVNFDNGNVTPNADKTNHGPRVICVSD